MTSPNNSFYLRRSEHGTVISFVLASLDPYAAVLVACHAILSKEAVLVTVQCPYIMSFLLLFFLNSLGISESHGQQNLCLHRRKKPS